MVGNGVRQHWPVVGNGGQWKAGGGQCDVWQRWAIVEGNDVRWWAMQGQSLLMASSDPCHQGKGIAAAIKEMYSHYPDILETRRKTRKVFFCTAPPRYLCRVIFSLGGSAICREGGAAWQKGKKEEETNTSHLHPQPPFIISNPWCNFILKQDDLLINNFHLQHLIQFSGMVG